MHVCAWFEITHVGGIGAVGELDLASYYLGQGFYRHEVDNHCWIFDYTITRNIWSQVMVSAVTIQYA